MRTIDVHAHLVPRSLWRAADAGKDWFGFRHEPGEGVGTMVGDGKRTHFASPKVRFAPEERLRDMDAQGVDVQVLSIHPPFFGYHLDSGQGWALARDVNDEIAAMVTQWPRRFAGLATLPVQDVKAAIAMGALLFFHPQPHHNFMMQRTTRYGLFNSLGVIVEDAIVVAILILGGILDACPDLRVCIAHGGG